MQVKKLTDLDVAGKRVFIRADLNVPQDDAGNITEDTRIRASIPSIKYALEGGAAVMVTSHLGRPTEGSVTADDTLAPVAVRLGQLLHKPVRLIQNWVDGGFSVAPGEVVLLPADGEPGDLRPPHARGVFRETAPAAGRSDYRNQRRKDQTCRQGQRQVLISCAVVAQPCSSNTAMLSTCAVWGNMFTTPPLVQR